MSENLTTKEQEMLNILKTQPNIDWSSTTANQTKILNSLVKKGYASVHATDSGKYTINTFWCLKDGPTCR